MTTSAQLIELSRNAWPIASGIGVLVVVGCGPPEAGSVKLPEELKRGTEPGYGPGMVKAGMSPPGSGQFRVEPKTKPGRRRGG